MNQPVSRIAVVLPDLRALSRRLASGVCRFATPVRGFITREFLVEDNACEVPDAFRAWAPKGVVSFLAGNRTDFLESAAEGGRPMVNMARCQPGSGLGVVIGDAEEVYDAVHAHFQELGIGRVVHYVLGENLGESGIRHRYKKYTDAQDLSYSSYSTEKDPKHIFELGRIKRVDEPLAMWLRNLPKPVGIFSQQIQAGPYLCHCCKLLGIRIPQEVAVIGSDGFDAALASTPPLTTVRLPAEQIGFEAAQMLATMLGGMPAPKEIVQVPGINLIIRESTGRAGDMGCDIDAALTFIQTHACEGVNVNDVLAETQSVSRMTFHKRFVEATGMTPATAILDRKMAEARRLVAETKISIGAISGMCGYKDDLYFSQVFRKYEGVAPRDYRRMQLKG